MSNCIAEMQPPRTWIQRDPIEDCYSIELRSALERARVELKGHTDEQVDALWLSLRDATLASYRRLDRPCPTYRQRFTISDDPEPETMHYGPEHERTLTNYVAAVWELCRTLSSHARPFRSFLAQLHKDHFLALAKCLALLTMHEARDRNPAGALRAADLLRVIDAKLRSRVEDATVIAQGRRRGGQRTGLKRQTEALLSQQAGFRIWKRCKAARYLRADTVKRVAADCEVTTDTARRWLAKFEKGQYPAGTPQSHT